MAEFAIPVQESSDSEETVRAHIECDVDDKSPGAFHIMWKATFDHESSITTLEDTADCLL